MRRWYLLIFSIALFAFFSAAFGRLSILIGGANLRWLMLPVLVAATALVQARLPVSTPRRVLGMLYLFDLYILITVFWSENPFLSFAKWGVFVLVSALFLLGGALIVMTRKDENPLLPLAPVYLITVLTAPIALVLGRGYNNGLFQGYMSNPNMFGAALVFTSPWVILELRRTWNDPFRRNIMLCLAIAGIVFLIMSKSRTAMLALTAILAFTFFSARHSRRVAAIFMAAMLALVAYLFSPGFYGKVKQEYILKSGPSLLYTRQQNFEVSWEKAQEGGIFGIGYGISAGLSSDWSGQTTTSVGFGREKGNSQLAIWEELGVVGLTLYALLLGTILHAIVAWGRRVKHRPDGKLYYFLMLGFFFGAFASSMFEAWFTAPGSPESAAYWATLGLGFGMLRRELLRQEGQIAT